MELILLFVTGFSLGLSGAMIPGPLFLFTVSSVLHKDVKAGVKIIFGHILLEILFLAVILLGLGSLLRSETVIRVTSVVGGAALIVMGIMIVAKIKGLSLRQEDNPEFRRGYIIGGAFFSIISPGFLIWWATIGTPFVLQSLLLGMVGVAVFSASHWLADFIWYWSVSCAVHKGKRLLNDVIFRRIMVVLAVLLMGLGSWYLIR